MKTVYCTIASANYLSRVMTLVESLERHQPGAEVRVLLCEHPSLVGQLSAELGFAFVAPDEIGCADWQSMAFAYDVTELNTALKPFFIQTLLRTGAEAVIYFDPDIELFHSTSELESLLLRHPCVVTPHNLQPLPDDGKLPSQLQVNRCGQFNLGFLAVRKTPEVDRFLAWWGERLRRDCVSDLPNGLFVDQSWANLVASFVPDGHVLWSQAYNFAYWNASQRRLWREAGKWITGDGPLVFFHYSGITLDQVERVSRHQNRLRAQPGTSLHDILTEYAVTLTKSPYTHFSRVPYSFDRFKDGAPIGMSMRRRFRALPRNEASQMGNPFAAREVLESYVEIDPEQREVDRLRSQIAGIDRLRAQVSELERQLAQTKREAVQASEGAAYWRSQLELLRYRTADTLNGTLKAAKVHRPTKFLIEQGELAAQRIGALWRERR